MTPSEAFYKVTDIIIAQYVQYNPRQRQLWELTVKEIRNLHKFNPNDWK
jgi:hypothetical protein